MEREKRKEPTEGAKEKRRKGRLAVKNIKVVVSNLAAAVCIADTKTVRRDALKCHQPLDFAKVDYALARREEKALPVTAATNRRILRTARSRAVVCDIGVCAQTVPFLRRPIDFIADVCDNTP